MRLAPIKWPNGDVREQLCEFHDDDFLAGYQELRERADDRLRDARSPGQVLHALKLQAYVQNRAYRELGVIV